MPLWRAGDEGNEVGLTVRPDGMLVLEQKGVATPALAFLVKETQPCATPHCTDDL